MKKYLFSSLNHLLNFDLFLEIKQGKKLLKYKKFLSLPMDGNLLKNQKGVRISLESVQKSCRKCPHLQYTLQYTF